jgi:CheY-like chemotaxis protein
VALMTSPLTPRSFGHEEGQRAQRAAPRGFRVLVIEDSIDTAETLKEVLELDGHNVALAFAGPAGLDKARTFRPDVVVCDIGLPGMDGYTVARALREDPVLCQVGLVALTGYATAADRRRAEMAGFDRHLSKPHDLAALERTISELAGKAKSPGRDLARPGSAASIP